MLDEIHVRDYALVRDARLVFSPGCTVLSGETGAGKTALVGAIKLLIGERGDVVAIRDGASELVVEGRIVTDDEEHIVVRRLSREGRSRCTLDDNMVAVGTLAERIGPLVDLHGQHEHQSLLAPAVQLAYLDRYAGEKGARALANYQGAWDACLAAADALEELRQASQASEQTLAAARQTVRDMEATAPQPGEYEELEQQLPILRNGESLAFASQAALDALRGGQEGQGALDALAAASRVLAQQAGVDVRLDELASQLESVVVTADDLAVSLRAYRDSVEFDPRALEAALDRLGALEALRRRYGTRMEDVFAAWQEATQQLALTGNLHERLEAAEAQLTDAEQALEAAACKLTQLRAQTAERFARDLSSSLRELALEGASVAFSLQELPRAAWTRSGPVRYELTWQPSEAGTPRPLAKIASGGELSRVMLAIKTLQAAPDGQVSLVFDEVDAGIGGVAATAVAERIRMLASAQQVIVVTHLAQIAAVADRQFVVEKTLADGAAATSIREVFGDERVAEIARMLAGSTDEVALAHARRLLESARGDEGATLPAPGHGSQEGGA
ncbi:MAG: DNA repair protein RecN [Coriobacteriales bacterium]|jgi:DNA repair protein RecN (Recombination protein N)|nr:DNA repair protein RecN [Coriobacteriales bacterium]